MENLYSVVALVRPDPKSKKKVITTKAVKLPSEDGIVVLKELHLNSPVIHKYPEALYVSMIENSKIQIIGEMSKQEICSIMR